MKGLEKGIERVGVWQSKYEKKIEKIDKVDAKCERMVGRLESIEKALGLILEKLGD